MITEKQAFKTVLEFGTALRRLTKAATKLTEMIEEIKHPQGGSRGHPKDLARTLEHVIDALQNPSRANTTLDAEAKMQKQAFLSRRQELISKYHVKVLGSCKIMLTLPAGSSREDFIKEVVQLQGDNYAWLPHVLDIIKGKPEFCKTYKQPKVIAVIGAVPGTNDKDKNEQLASLERRKLRPALVEDLLLCKVAYEYLMGKTCFLGTHPDNREWEGEARAANGSLDAKNFMNRVNGGTICDVRMAAYCPLKKGAPRKH